MFAISIYSLISGPEVLDDTGSKSCNLGVGTLLFPVSMHITLFAVSVHITLGKTDKKNRKTQKRQTWKLSNLLRVRFPNFSILLEKMRRLRHFWPKFENGGGSGRFRMDQNENVMDG